ncbi:MAG: hypothetical protein BV458_03525 [Thermoplasmata archaeon M9B2D]|nr:MAG: hypothetical protein BV458_03525 [Thermoplasmata archaeon M9B2D]
MMTDKERMRHESALNKFSGDDKLLDLIDLTHLIYRQTDTHLSFPDYLRTILITHAELKRHGKTIEE